MAIASFAPAITRSREAVLQKSARAALRLAPDVAPGESVDHRYFLSFMTVIGVVGLLLLLVINTALAQDAFELHKLKVEATSLSDQREAVLREVARVSSPEHLAVQAKSLGMVASQSPRFLTLNSPVTAGTKG